MNTLLLSTATWDLVIDASNNIAIASNPYSLAQDAASAIRLFLGELYYDTTQGVPYFQQILGRRPNIALMKAKMAAAALTVPGVSSATVFITSIANRQVNGQVQVTDASGNVTAAAFVSPVPTILPPVPTPPGQGPMNFSVPGNIAITAAIP